MKLMSKIEKIAQFILLFELGDILINPEKNKLYAQFDVQSQLNDENLKDLIKNHPDQMEVDGVLIGSPLIGFYEDKANIISYIKKFEIENKDYIIRYTVYLKNKSKSIDIYSFKYKPQPFITKDNSLEKFMDQKDIEQISSLNNDPLESIELLIKDKYNYMRISPDSRTLNLIKEKLHK